MASPDDENVTVSGGKFTSQGTTFTLKGSTSSQNTQKLPDNPVFMTIDVEINNGTAKVHTFTLSFNTNNKTLSLASDNKEFLAADYTGDISENCTLTATITKHPDNQYVGQTLTLKITDCKMKLEHMDELSLNNTFKAIYVSVKGNSSTGFEKQFINFYNDGTFTVTRITDTIDPSGATVPVFDAIVASGIYTGDPTAVNGNITCTTTKMMNDSGDFVDYSGNDATKTLTISDSIIEVQEHGETYTYQAAVRVTN